MKTSHFFLICILSLLCCQQTDQSEVGFQSNQVQEIFIETINDIEKYKQKEECFCFNPQRPLFLILNEGSESITTLLRSQLESQRIIIGQRIMYAIKSIVKNYSQQCTFESCKLLLQFTHHPFQSTLRSPSQYYIFAMRRILV